MWVGCLRCVLLWLAKDFVQNTRRKTRANPNFVKAKSRCDESCYLRIVVVVLPREPLSEESRSFVTLLLSESSVQIHSIGRF
jgi:hypothetical protein